MFAKILGISLILLFPVFSMAQSISSYSGTFNDEDSIVIYGGAFGANGPTVEIFADFEEGANGDVLFSGTGSANYGEWDHEGNGSGTDIYSNVTSVSGSLAARFDQSSGSNFLGATFPNTNREVFIVYWLFLPLGDDYPGYERVAWKPVWVAGTDTDDDDMVIPSAVSSSGTAIESSGEWIFNRNDPDPNYTAYVQMNFTRGRWHRVSTWIKGGTNSTSNDGHAWFWYLNSDLTMHNSLSDDAANVLAADGAFERTRINGWGEVPANPCHPTFDDVYMAYGDYARARVEVGDASTYTACNNMTILRPTSWTDGSITAVFNQGSFSATDQAYLYVVDSDGNISSPGFPITIGEGGEPLEMPGIPSKPERE